MSRSRELDHQLHILQEISGIMSAMKTLALVEIRKLSRLRDNHQQVEHTIQTAAQDFFSFYPHLCMASDGGAPLMVVVGSERGFCGSFNQNLVEALADREPSTGESPLGLIPVGAKLAGKYKDHPQVITALTGATTGEDVPTVLTELLETILALPKAETGLAGLNLWAVYHSYDDQGIQFQKVTAFPLRGVPSPVHPYPPGLQLSPPQFLTQLLEQHLFAFLSGVFYSSLMAENRFRLAHMEGALRRVEQKNQEMAMTRNMLRQEEITQEIELMLLDVEETVPGSEGNGGEST